MRARRMGKPALAADIANRKHPPISGQELIIGENITVLVQANARGG